jgi:hypothetical protein
MSHKIAHLSLDFAGEESVSGGERRCCLDARTVELTIMVYLKQMRG